MHNLSPLRIALMASVFSTLSGVFAEEAKITKVSFETPPVSVKSSAIVFAPPSNRLRSVAETGCLDRYQSQFKKSVSALLPLAEKFAALLDSESITVKIFATEALTGENRLGFGYEIWADPTRSTWILSEGIVRAPRLLRFAQSLSWVSRAEDCARDESESVKEFSTLLAHWSAAKAAYSPEFLELVLKKREKERHQREEGYAIFSFVNNAEEEKTNALRPIFNIRRQYAAEHTETF